MRRKKVRKIIIGLFVIWWLFTGWPVVWNNPRIPLITPVHALNQINNWGFESPSGANQAPSNWSANDTTDSMTGTPEVKGLTSNTVSYAGSQSVYGRWTSNATNQGYSYTLYQNFTPGANVKAKLRGYYRREHTSNQAAENSTYDLEIASGTTNGIGGTVVVSAISNTVSNTTIADANFTTAPNSGTWSSEVTLNSGTTYTIRIRWTGTNLDKGEYGGGWFDNVELLVAPVGLSASAPANTTNVQLDWTTSTAGTGANAINSTTPYKVYRDGASPVSTFLSNATTNSYTDSSTAGNTTYYYAITDLDTAGSESPKSAEVSILTRPGAPGTPTFSNIKDQTLTVNWTAPTNGATSYKIERCSGSGCSSFSEIRSGETNTTYNDSGLSGNTLYRYRVRATNATGDGPYSNIGEVTTKFVSITLTSDGSISYGLVALNSSKSTIQLSDTQTASNSGNITSTFNIKSSNAIGGAQWTIGANPGNNIFVHEFSTNNGSNWTKFTNADSYQTLVTGITEGSSQSFDLRITLPTNTTDYQEKTITTTVQVVSQ